MKGSRQPPKSANTATIGTVMAEHTPLMANKALTAWARFPGEMTSDTAPTAVGGSVPPAKPVNILSANSTSILGAKADARTDTEH